MRAVSLSTIGRFVTTPGSDRLNAAPGFGVRPDGSAYFDPDGAAGGQAAFLRLDPSGRVTLIAQAPGLMLSARPPVAAASRPAASTAIRAPSLTPRGPMSQPGPVAVAEPRKPVSTAGPAVRADVREGRPVGVADPVTAPVVARRPVSDRPPGAPTVSLRAGRPVHQADPVTLPVLEGRPVALPKRRRAPRTPQPGAKP